MRSSANKVEENLKPVQETNHVFRRQYHANSCVAVRERHHQQMESLELFAAYGLELCKIHLGFARKMFQPNCLCLGHYTHLLLNLTNIVPYSPFRTLITYLLSSSKIALAVFLCFLGMSLFSSSIASMNSS